MLRINEEIFYYRENLDMNQQEFGKLFNRNRKTVSGWENENNNIPLDIIIKYASVTNSSLDYIFEISEEKIKYSKIDITHKELGKKLRDLRKSKNITQKKLATKLNTNQSVISRYERGINPINISFFIGVIKELKSSSIDELFNRVEIKEIKNDKS